MCSFSARIDNSYFLFLLLSLDIVISITLMKDIRNFIISSKRKMAMIFMQLLSVSREGKREVAAPVITTKQILFYL